MALRVHSEDDETLLDPLARSLLRRLRPGIGWPLGLLVLAAALCPGLAAAESSLRLPLGLVFWAGLFGCIVGMRVGRPRPAGRPFARLRLFGWMLGLSLGGSALFVGAANDVLPSLGLMLQDLGAFVSWALAVLREPGAWAALPISRTWVFLAGSLPRAWEALLAAPNADEGGARLLTASLSAALTWLGALLLGWAVPGFRPILGWGLPLLAALLATTVMGGGYGFALMSGLASLLLLAIMVDFRQREERWLAANVAFSDQLRFDVALWSVLLAGGLLLVAWLLPASPSSPVARFLWAEVEVPSGIAVIERNALPRPAQPTAIAALSALPALRLGHSLEEGPPGQLAARIRLEGPLPASPTPHYWRARVLNVYTGRGWTSNALVSSLAASPLPPEAPPGTLLQRVEHARPEPRLLLALPDVVVLDAPAQAEYLADGTLAAAQVPLAAYGVLSRPPTAAAEPIGAPPDLPASYLQLPASLPPRVQDLALAVASGAPPRQQALALEAYLRALPYSYAVQPLPEQGDAVDQFLFKMRHGYCTYYASAMAVMARSLGIPSRVAVGYSTGTFDPNARAYSVFERDAHAWPELYIDGRWEAFEPTPARPLPPRGVPAAPLSPPDLALDTPQASVRSPAWMRALLLIAAVLLAALAGVFWLRRRSRPVPLVTLAQQGLERYGTQLGVAWPAGATLDEYGALLGARQGSAANLDEVVALVSRARYSGRQLSDAEQQRLHTWSERLRSLARQLRLRHLTWRR